MVWYDGMVSEMEEMAMAAGGDKRAIQLVMHTHELATNQSIRPVASKCTAAVPSNRR